MPLEEPFGSIHSSQLPNYQQKQKIYAAFHMREDHQIVCGVLSPKIQ